MIGALDQRITLQSYSTTSDGGGGSVETWADFTTVPNVWAKVDPMSGGERMEDGAFNASGMWKFTIRNRDDVNELHRIKWGGVSYNIRQVDRRGDRALYLEILAERGAPQ